MGRLFVKTQNRGGRVKEIKSGKVSLDSEAAESLMAMCREIKGKNQFVKIRPSMLASWIVKRFHATIFEREKDKVWKAYLDRRRWLYSSLKNAPDDKLEDVLKDALADMVTPKRQRKRRPLKT